MKISSHIQNLVPYKPGKPIAEAQRELGLKEIYKLASNENPLGPSPKALSAIQMSLATLHLYPDPTQHELLMFLAKKWGLSPEQIAFGNGSDELIDILVRIYCEPGDGILQSRGSFAAYSVSANAARVEVYETPLKNQFQIDLEGLKKYFLENYEKKKIKLIFLPNPNNPTGTIVNRDELTGFFKTLGNRDDVLLVVDEAYNEFVRSPDYVSTQTEFYPKYSNVIVLRTFSKAYGLAGLRVGAMIAPTEVVSVFNKVRKPFNVNTLAQVAVMAAYDDTEYIEKSRQLVWRSLDYFYQNLKQLNLAFVPSQGNFVLFDTGRDASKVHQALLRKGIIMRPVGGYGFPRHLRLSVGLEKENHKAIAALAEVLKEIPHG